MSFRAEYNHILLKNGYIVDGTRRKGSKGSVLINGSKIERITDKDVDTEANVIDCSGKIIAPGFIDMHSHNDWVMPSNENEKYTGPFISQGITTFVAGNCGFCPAGYKKNSPYKDLILESLFKASNGGLKWDTINEYFEFISKKGISTNLIELAGHGTTRASIRGTNPTPMRFDETREMLYLLEEAMDNGAWGVSLGLQYEPGIFSTMDELQKIAELVKKKDKILSVHAKALSALSGTYPWKPLGKPHNLLAIEDMLNLAGKTGVRLQFSHLIFVGESSWGTWDGAVKLFEKAAAKGIDVKFDIYAYTCGASVITVILPEWFMARVPEVYNDSKALKRLNLEMWFIQKFLGFGYKDIQITYANHPELNKYNGMFLYDIARVRNISQFENYIDFARRSKGRARVIMYKYSNTEIIESLMKYNQSLFMTDAWIEPEGMQNPASFGCFPRFLQMARDKKTISLEEAVHKMSGACAERVGIKNRGIIKEGYAADITIFNWNTVMDNTTVKDTGKSPSGIEHVFINGTHVLENGKITGQLNSGIIVK